VIAVCLILVGSFKNLTFLPVVISNTLIGIIQEIRAKKTLDKLNILNAPKNTVIRDGQEKTIPSEELVLDAYDKHGVTFTGIMPDENLAKWIMTNLEGLPTTIFVDSEGMPRDFKIEGMQDKDYYMETTESMLKAIGK
jgi:hypothetical protein